MILTPNLHYDMYSTRVELFNRNIRENALLDNSDLMIPFAQHSGLATKLLDVTSNSLVALYFACQQTEENSDGYIYVFDDYADITNVLEKYPYFDLENELLKHLKLLREQTGQLIESKCGSSELEYTSVKHEELEDFGECIEHYREKYLQGGNSKYSVARGISKEDSLFTKKRMKLISLLEEIKSWVINISSKSADMSAKLLPIGYTPDTPAIDLIHPYKEKRYAYYNEQYKKFDIEVKEYLISLECILAFISDKSSVLNLSSMFEFENLTMDFLPNFLYSPVLTFKRGVSQQSSFFYKHYLISMS
ncbi:FRG domain-containing protein [Enterococcus sp. LJL99]